MQKPEKAYKNIDFLTSPEGRTVRILSEFYEPKARFEKYHIMDTVVFFGSARISDAESAKQKYEAAVKKYDSADPEGAKQIKNAATMLTMSKYYEDAVELSKKLTEWSLALKSDKKRFIICSGGGPGIMEAANKGAHLAGGHSIGLNISIPFEQFVNPYVDPEYAFEFHYFFMRKFWFMYLAKALVVFPGGFGTLDELMELLTLQQTGKIKKPLKIIIFDKKYWAKVINLEAMVDMGTISESDLDLFDFCDTVDDAFNKMTAHFTEHYINKGKG
ncbi:MAG: TIGR00730 family Rossman fold protein [Ignavibacteriales bacterium]|nr:TIGR00730 family Rossman fold protein [Ignavibacteriales bacterium]MCF8305560.1 TIGR00730 family Rossman fold protein [Ignavibacteriales bacterium]MCF8315282.1 TIGR00730 family Rossman fold protein [Ignavibacteriales bacterium]MCF8436826.1 TIGR00730 family Rossman fold protein [Ignavibacteriales bacterium]